MRQNLKATTGTRGATGITGDAKLQREPMLFALPLPRVPRVPPSPRGCLGKD